MANDILARSYVAGASLGALRVVKFGADANTVIQTTGPTDGMFGVTENTLSSAGYLTGERVDVHIMGVRRVVAGGVFNPGDPLTSDANGAVVKAVPAAGVNNRIIGFAITGATASGDQVEVLLSQSQIQG